METALLVSSASACTVATDVIRQVSQMEEFQVGTGRTQEVLTHCEELIALRGQEKTKLLELLSLLEKKVSSVITSVGSCRSLVTRNESCKQKILQFRLYELPKLLKRYKLPGSDDLILWQCALDKLFMDRFFKDSEYSETATSRTNLTVIEDNAVRYTAGYVIRKMARKYKHTELMPCIETMTMDIPSLTEQEKDESMTWTLQTNRGGLKLASDTVFSLFQEIELNTFPMIEQSYKNHQSVAVDDIILAVTEDQDTLYLWDTISLDMPSEAAQKLLEDIVKEWITIRGHSFGKERMEQYKLATKNATKGKKSLRTELKKSYATTTEF